MPNRFRVLRKKNARDRGGSSFLRRVKRAFPDDPKGRTWKKRCRKAKWLWCKAIWSEAGWSKLCTSLARADHLPTPL